MRGHSGVWMFLVPDDFRHDGVVFESATISGIECSVVTDSVGRTYAMTFIYCATINR
jgi:hypothetical protein